MSDYDYSKAAREGLKTIVITWADMRPGHYGELCAALWTAEGTDADLNAALRYAGAVSSRAQVHTFPTDRADWKQAAIDAHNNGCGL